jgi:hypothetical protein
MIFQLFFMGILVLVAIYIFRTLQEGYTNPNVSPSLFVPRVTPGGNEELSDLNPAGTNNINNEKIIASSELPPMSELEAVTNWGKMTSEKCFRSDIGESLKKTRNYLQRTNNYKHMHPDSCSAPNHEFVGTFYTPFDGVGRYPLPGTNFPKLS